MMLLGIDAGTTVTKSVLFDLHGVPVASASRRVPLSYPRAHHVERDQDDLWRAVAETVDEVLAATGRPQIAAVGVTSHGDGLYLVDSDGRQTRPGIMSLDTRASGIVRQWETGGVSDRALVLTGQRPWPSAPAALLRWLVDNEPDVVTASAWALPAKDMLRQRLTGEFSTELTEASLSFTDVRTQQYSDEVVELFGLSEQRRLLPPVLSSGAVSGHVTEDAADLTGLPEGVPIAATAHDVDCSAIGTGVISPGLASVVAGSFSINQAISYTPVLGDDWCARSFIEPGSWMNMSLSPTSAATMEWFAQTLCADDIERGRLVGDPFGFIDREVAEVAGDPSVIRFLPFLFGSPFVGELSGTFTGLGGWHTRGHLLRAIMEGVAFTHRYHVDALASAHAFDAVRLTGGASRSRIWSQVFADVLGRRIEVTTAEESGALGAALLAGVAAGVYPSLVEAVESAVQVERVHEPDPSSREHMDRAYADFMGIIKALQTIERKDRDD